MRLAVLIVGCVSFLGALAVYAILAALGKDTIAYVGFVSMASGTLVAQIANLFKSQSISTDIQEVKKATNGPLAAAVQQITAVHDAVIPNGETKT